MTVFFKLPSVGVLAAIALCSPGSASAQERNIPEVLKPWQDWVTWSDVHQNCPTTYQSAADHICFWPSQLSLSANQQNGSWKASVTVFAETWVPLPGNDELWPFNVRADGKELVVVERDGSPMVRLPRGRHELTGAFAWDEIPQKLAIPPQIGLLSLMIEGQAVTIPSWDEAGNVWLKRLRTEQAERDSLGAQVYCVIEDGIPIWLRTEIELSVSGKSREEELGWVLPRDWQLSTVDSPIPVAVDDRGQMKAQVRAGKWIIHVDAFRTVDAGEIQFAEDAQPITNVELVGFQANAEFRLAELEGIPVIDVAQTTFPAKWRNLPVYQWDTGSPFRLTEKMRGMGLQRPEGLSIRRQFWIDEDGQGLTYRDAVTGRMQQIWRLDVADGQQLGAVRVDGKGQLITANPSSGADGVEIRARNLNLEAIGRVDQLATLSATGWQTDADSLGITLTLPPGWRAFALFGADNVEGDWLTAWSLLDLFVLLIFSLAVFRMYGVSAGIVAFLAFGLTYHEPGSPRLTWLFLLMPLALLKVVSAGTSRNWIMAWKYVAVALLVINLVPFVASQLQNALYPQLEPQGVTYAPRSMFWRLGRVYQQSARMADVAFETSELARQDAELGRDAAKSRFESSNLLYDPKARIQTGPAEPDWTWNQVYCRWDGPVSADQQLKPILISLTQHRWLTLARLLLLMFLAAFLLGVRKFRLPWLMANKVAAGAVLLWCTAHPLPAAEIPDKQMLDLLRQRLLEPADAYPQAAEIASVELKLDGGRITMSSVIHAALGVAVPLPGRVPVWSPVSVSVDDQPADLVCRKEGFLWVVLPPGVHRVVVESLLPEISEWEWTFLLKPHRVAIEAPGWNVTGVRANGVPEQQVFFARQQQPAAGEAAYDRKDFRAVVVVDRHVETGLQWQVRNEVTRLSAPGKAVSLRVPLLAGERVLSSNAVVADGFIEVRLGAAQQAFSWQSELSPGADIQLIAPAVDQAVERWHLVSSPVWNVTQAGLAPVFESQEQNLIPVWHPWPGEEVTLTFNRPAPVSGDTMTVQFVQQDTSLVSRQRTTDLRLGVDCSVGGDFEIELNPAADITSLKREGQSIPVRRDGAKLLVPVQPGKQTVEVAWRTDVPLRTVVVGESVSLPVKGANITTVMRVPESRWVLWADGPLQGPAVRFWTILVSAILAGLALGSLAMSPLRRFEWVLLAIGLTQVHVVAALFVVFWLFLLSWRGTQDPVATRYWLFNLRQVLLVVITLIALGILIVVVGAGLLGSPEMFILGNGSTRTMLNWFQPQAGQGLPEPRIISVSVWFYRLLMLFWALWLASALLRWLQWGWQQYSHGGSWRRKPIIAATAVRGDS